MSTHSRKNLYRPFVLVNRRFRNRIDNRRLFLVRTEVINCNELVNSQVAHSNETIFITFYSYCLQTIIIGNSFKKLYQKLVLRVSSGVLNTSKQEKHSACRLVLSSVSWYLEPLMKHEARVFDILLQEAINTHNLPPH